MLYFIIAYILLLIVGFAIACLERGKQVPIKVYDTAITISTTMLYMLFAFTGASVIVLILQSIF